MKSYNSLQRTLFLLLLTSISPGLAFAGSATWNLNPTNVYWNTAANWTPATVPNGPNDIATFEISNITALSFSAANTEVNSIVFSGGASAFDIEVGSAGGPFLISGAGVVNNSGITQNFATVRDLSSGYGEIQFLNSAKAGVNTVYRIGEPTDHTVGSDLTDSFFWDNSSADHATLITETSSVYFVDNSTAAQATILNADGAYPAGHIWFEGNSTAGDAVITNAGSRKPGGAAGFTYFLGFASAGNATIVVEGGANGGPGAYVVFDQGSTIGQATIMAMGASGEGNGGLITIGKDSAGGDGRIMLFGNSKLDISFHHLSSGVTIGSLQGEGTVFLGANTLAIGSNNLSTTFTGKIRNGGSFGGNNGAFVKIGKGSLTLTNANTYGGGTTVSRGTLLVTNRNGSATGVGPVQVIGGTLGGNGIIAGPVTMGTGKAPTFLAPGNSSSTAVLTLQGSLTFNNQANYAVKVDGSAVDADEVIANGVTINGGTSITFTDIGGVTVQVGVTLPIINNISATPILGTFGNLADGSIVTVRNNKFQVNYEGGDGNDLVLVSVR